MSRAKTILQPEFPYHVSARSHNKQWFSIPLADVWKIMTHALHFMSLAYGVKIHSFVLLNNHFHLLITTPQSNIDKALWYFMSAVSREINEQAGAINQVFGARYFKCVIENDHYYMHVYKYVYRNPVHAGLVDKCEDYPFSSLQGLLGARHLMIPVVADGLLFPEVHRNLDWLNRTPNQNQWKSVGLALSKNKFVLAKNKSNRPNKLEVDAL